MNWQDRWMVPLAAMALAGLILYNYVLDSYGAAGLGAFTPKPIAVPSSVFVHPKLRDPFMLANEWDSVLVNRDKLIKDRQAAAEVAREEEEQARLEREDEEYFKRYGKRRGRFKKKLAPVTVNVTVTGKARPTAPPPPPPPPGFSVRGVLIGGGQRTAVVNDRIVSVGDVVQGFKVVTLTIDILELMGTVEPWKGKRLRIDVTPPPPGIRFVKARSLLQSSGERTGGRNVIVIPPMIGDPASSTTTGTPATPLPFSPQATPTPAAPTPAGEAPPPPADDRPWWKKLTDQPATPVAADRHPLEDRPR